MFGKSKLGDTVASEMDRILGDAGFNSVFAKPELSADYADAVNQEPSYKAFTRVASKKSKAEDKLLALDHIAKSLSETSAVLDNLGLERSATSTLSLINGIFKEARVKLAQIANDPTDGIADPIDPDLARRIEEGGQNLLDPSRKNPEVKFPKDPHAPSRMPTDPDLAFADDEDEDDKDTNDTDDETVSFDKDGNPIYDDYYQYIKHFDKPIRGKNPKNEDTILFPTDNINVSRDANDADDEDDDEDANDADDKDDDDCGDAKYAAYRLYLEKKAAAEDKVKDKAKAKAKAQKECAAFARKTLKENGCKGKVEITEKGIEVFCKGTKENCTECCKEIMDFCKEKKVSCKTNKEFTDKAKKKAEFEITDQRVITAMREIDAWLKE